MKKVCTILGLMLGLSQAAWAQSKVSPAPRGAAKDASALSVIDSTTDVKAATAAPDKEMAALRKSQQVLAAVVDSLRTQLKAEARTTSAESHIATMSLRPGTSFPVYAEKTIIKKKAKNEKAKGAEPSKKDIVVATLPETDKVFKLSRIEFSTEGGRLTRVNVYGKVLDDKGNVLNQDARFTNARTSLVLNRPITTLNYLGTLGGGNEYVRYSDLVQVMSVGSRRFLPDNENWELTPASPSHDIHTGGGLGSLLEVALFTDLLATLNNEPNALVTTEIASNFILNPNPAFKNGPFFFFGVVRPYVAVARLDTRFDTLRTNRNGLIDRPGLLQRNYLRFGANLNVLTFDNGRHVTWQLNTSWTRTLTRVAGPAGTRDTLRSSNTYQNLYGFELLLAVRRQRNFGCDFFFTALLHNVQSHQPAIANSGAEWVLRPGAQFYYHPFGSPSNKLFFRVTNFVFPEARQRDFAQLQVGYSISLGALLPASTTGATPATRSLSSGLF